MGASSLEWRQMCKQITSRRASTQPRGGVEVCEGFEDKEKSQSGLTGRAVSQRGHKGPEAGQSMLSLGGGAGQARQVQAR